MIRIDNQSLHVRYSSTDYIWILVDSWWNWWKIRSNFDFPHSSYQPILSNVMPTECLELFWSPKASSRDKTPWTVTSSYFETFYNCEINISTRVYQDSFAYFERCMVLKFSINFLRHPIYVRIQFCHGIISENLHAAVIKLTAVLVCARGSARVSSPAQRVQPIEKERGREKEKRGAGWQEIPAI